MIGKHKILKKIMASSIETFKLKYYLTDKGMSSDTMFIRECNGIQCEDKLIHEHNFVTETIKKRQLYSSMYYLQRILIIFKK